MKTWFSGFRSTATKAWKRLSGSVTATGSDSNSVLPSGLWTSRKGAIIQAKKKMADLGGRWGVAKVDGGFIEVERTYFKVHNVKPVWFRKTFIEWLTRTGI
jgi:hypothetical protein